MLFSDTFALHKVHSLFANIHTTYSVRPHPDGCVCVFAMIVNKTHTLHANIASTLAAKRIEESMWSGLDADDVLWAVDRMAKRMPGLF